MSRVSVLLPAYNRERMIGPAIESILGQTHQDLRLIIYDDGSTDGTLAVAERYAKADVRILIMRGGENRGIPHVRNRLLGAVQTDVAAWQDSDDVSNRYRLELQLRELERSRKRLVFAGCKILQDHDFEKQVISQELWKRTPLYAVEYQQGNASALFKMAGIPKFNEAKTLGGEDSEWIQRVEKEDGPAAAVPAVLYFIRFHDNRIGIWKRAGK